MIKSNVDKVVIGDATLYRADVLDGLALLPDDSVQCVVTSPPYWGLRRYIEDDSPEKKFEIGLEPTLQEWLDKMVAVFAEVRRVLRPDGTLWLNCGDAYTGSNNKWRGDKKDLTCKFSSRGGDEHTSKQVDGLKPKDLLLMPARLAIALQEDGWWVRSAIVWAKPNPMPESVTDRPTSSYEMVYLLTKSARYYYDQEAVRENHEHPKQDFEKPRDFIERGDDERGRKLRCGLNPAGRNLRNVWTIATQPYPDAHFATFPQELVRRCIAAGTSERGCCPECGKPWVRIVPLGEVTSAGGKYIRHEGNVGKITGESAQQVAREHRTLGWESTCTCDRDLVPCTVLDPFAGSGTTILVALKMGRRAIGIELSPEYIAMGIERISKEANQLKMSF